VYQLEGIHPLLKLYVLIRKLGLVLDLAQLLADQLLCARSKGCKVRTIPQQSDSNSMLANIISSMVHVIFWRRMQVRDR
jgi:hypothetical protein